MKDSCLHPARKIYYGVCSCRETYIGETMRNVENRQNKSNILSEQSNPFKHYFHHFHCVVICNAPVKNFTRKILEACFYLTVKANSK